MEIVIMGGGKVGETLIRILNEENHTVTLIEQNEKVLDDLLNTYDIAGVLGNGAAYSIQIEAGVHRADIFIAATQSDEGNLIAAITASKLGARHTVARVRNPEYSENMDFLKDSMGVSLLINPEKEASEMMMRMLVYPTAVNVESIGSGRAYIVEVEIPDSAPMIGIPLNDYNDKFGKVIVCVIKRGEEIIIPNGNSVLRAGDSAVVTGQSHEVHRFCGLLCQGATRIHSVMVVGGGKVSNYFTERLLKKNLEVKIIESNEENADRLALEFPKADVIHGDGTKHKLLRKERLDQYDALVALTGIDEENILLSLFAHKLGVKKTITKVNRRDLLNILDHVGLDSTVTPHLIIANQIIRYVRNTANSEGSNLEKFRILFDGQVEILTFFVNKNFPCLNYELKDVAIVDNVLVLLIIRNDELIFPRGNTRILAGDDIVLATSNKGFQDLSEIIRSTPQ